MQNSLRKILVTVVLCTFVLINSVTAQESRNYKDTILHQTATITSIVALSGETIWYKVGVNIKYRDLEMFILVDDTEDRKSVV